MKKIVISIIVIAFIITAGVLEQVYITNSFDKLEENAIEIYTTLQAENYDLALEQTQELQDWWYGRRKLLEMICPTADVKEMAKEIGELQGSQYAEMYDDSVTRANVLREMARTSRNLLTYKWKNIF